jgi:ketosteroid isomerase-like protein
LAWAITRFLFLMEHQPSGAVYGERVFAGGATARGAGRLEAASWVDPVRLTRGADVDSCPSGPTSSVSRTKAAHHGKVIDMQGNTDRNGPASARMPDEDRLQLVRQLFTAFAAGDRSTVESIIAEDFTFSTPLDVGLDRAGYFERCWPSAGNAQDVEFVRLLACGDEVIGTYENKNPDATTGRNTEIFAFEGRRISRVEVYFGWTS